ncbi:hypothetical protein BIT28_13265 [Photobacterium proteolyticum]|uniref:DUF3313 domain-containing protein n=1 Tax=Photobacterium proteolyticum TaxID=1903952 RepID=A0A1Q9GKD9_9GAMM|nr:DUF3313 family protein [Photobacterium proteolyticum]OLQ74952.1 hypothetical protein BIT28_13265 [Photobacterium proteolyticum]
MNKTALMMLIVSLALAGCSSRLPTEREREMGLVQNSDKLVEVTYTQDATGLQWVSPELEISQYSKLHIAAVGLHQNAKAVHQIPEPVLERVSARLTKVLKQELTGGVALVEVPEAQAATLKIMISRASTDMEDLQITEVLPYGALIGGAKALLGTRDRNVRILVESQLVDSRSEEILAERVGVILAKGVLENDSVELEYDQIRETVDSFTQDIVHFIRLTAYQASLNETEQG